MEHFLFFYFFIFFLIKTYFIAKKNKNGNKDHWSQNMITNIIMKKIEILQEL